MTEYSPAFIVAAVGIVATNLICVRYTAGVRNNTLNLFVLCALSFYLLLTPSVYFFQGKYSSINVDVRHYFGVGLLQIALHLAFYSIGYYLVLDKRSVENTFANLERTRRSQIAKAEKTIVFTFAVLFGVIFINTLMVGINLADVILGRYGEPTLGLQGGSYYLQNFADSLITLVVAAQYCEVRRGFRWAMMIVAVPLFLVLGFRYRILLMVFGMAIVHMHLNGFARRSIIRYLLAVGAFFYGLMFLTANRTAIYMQQYENVSFETSELPYDAIFDQAKGSLIDFALYKAVAEGAVQIDYGKTMIGYVLVKMTPSVVFPGAKKPYPPPQMQAIDRAIGAGREIGEAVTCVGGAFFALWYPGVIIGAVLLGVVTGHMQNKARKDTTGVLVGIAVILALFQWITRGYFPQVVDHLAYMLFPVILLRLRLGEYVTSDREATAQQTEMR